MVIIPQPVNNDIIGNIRASLLGIHILSSKCVNIDNVIQTIIEIMKRVLNCTEVVFGVYKSFRASAERHTNKIASNNSNASRLFVEEDCKYILFI
tara:strand:- start:402 stop:686 length:285 start_codon:yes stop_codon:yes gene_type:complete